MSGTFCFRVAGADDVKRIGELVRTAYADVAARFSLNRDNCPAHNAFMADEVVLRCMALGATFLLAEDGTVPCGCISFRRPEGRITMLEKLAVPPSWRHRGLGAALLLRACAMAEAAGADVAEIGVIAENERLRHWYEKLGFRFHRDARVDHLPFVIVYMRKSLRAENETGG